MMDPQILKTFNLNTLPRYEFQIDKVITTDRVVTFRLHVGKDSGLMSPVYLMKVLIGGKWFHFPEVFGLESARCAISSHDSTVVGIISQRIQRIVKLENNISPDENRVHLNELKVKEISQFIMREFISVVGVFTILEG